MKKEEGHTKVPSAHSMSKMWCRMIMSRSLASYWSLSFNNSQNESMYLILIQKRKAEKKRRTESRQEKRKQKEERRGG